MPTFPYPVKNFERTVVDPVSESACIWLLDDDASMLKALGRLLTWAGFKVEMFSDPAAFLATVDFERCPVAILDVWMPEMNGLEVQAELSKESPKTRIIFISGRDDPSVRQAALEGGAFGFLTKPFDDEGPAAVSQELQLWRGKRGRERERGGEETDMMGAIHLCFKIRPAIP